MAIIGFSEDLVEQSDSDKANKVANDFASISNSFGDLAASLKDINPELAATLETMQDLSAIGSEVAKSIGSFISGDIVGGISGAISAIAGVFRIGAKSRESERKAKAELLKLQQQEIEGQRELNRLAREGNIEAAKALELSLKRLAAQKEALNNAARENANDFSDVLSELQSERFVTNSSTEKYGGVLGIGRKSRVVNEYGSLLGKTFEEIQELYEKGKLEDRAKELFEQLRKLKEEGADIQSQLDELVRQANEIFTGTTSDSIADSIIDGLRNGRTAVEDFAQDMERTLQGAILNAIKYQVLEEPLQELYRQFAAFAESDGELTAEEAEAVRNLYESTVQKAIDTYNQFNDVLDLGLLNADNAPGLSGAIKRELTEETGSALVGVQRGIFGKLEFIYDINRRQLDADLRANEQLHEMVRTNALIEVNTRNTVEELKLHGPILRKIAENTKPARSSRDQGGG